MGSDETVPPRGRQWDNGTVGRRKGGREVGGFYSADMKWVINE